MTMTKKEILEFVSALPQRIDIEDLFYRLYIKTQLDAAEEDIRKNRTLPHAKIMKEIEKWFQSGGQGSLSAIWRRSGGS